MTEETEREINPAALAVAGIILVVIFGWVLFFGGLWVLAGPAITALVGGAVIVVLGASTLYLGARALTARRVDR